MVFNRKSILAKIFFMTPSICLIISTYNSPIFLELVLLSVIRQRVLPKEVIIADDGSKSETKELIDRFKELFPIPLLHVWHKDEGYQLSKIKNKAVAASSSDYIIFIDGDLLLHPFFISDYQKNICKGEILVASRVFLKKSFTENLIKNKNKRVNVSLPDIEKNILNSFRIYGLHQLIKGKTSYKGARGGLLGIFKKDYLDVNGFDEAFTGWGREDSDLFVRLLNNGIRRRNIKFAAITYHLWHPQLSRDKLSVNDALLEKTISLQLKWCEKGISQYV